MRHLLLIPLLGFATSASFRAEDANRPAPFVLLQEKYEMLNGEFSITFTGPDTVLYEDHGVKFTGTYMIHPDGDVVLISVKDPPKPPRLFMLEFAGKGMLYGGRDTMLAVAAVKEKSKAVLSDLERLGRARSVVFSCLRYASDHEGQLPKRLADLLPDYAPSGDIFGHRSPQETIEGYEYLGAGVSKKDAPGKTILRAKDTASDGKRIVGHLDGTVKIQTDG